MMWLPSHLEESLRFRSCPLGLIHFIPYSVTESLSDRQLQMSRLADGGQTSGSC